LADSNLNSSISALVSDLQNQIATASVTELLLITRAAKSIGHTENTAIEIAVNTRVNQLTSTATADELEKLARAVDNLTDTTSAATATTSISDHTDVDTTTTPPTDGQALVWENSTALWKPNDIASGSYTDILPDTTATYDLGSPSKTWVDVYASNIKGLDAPINDTDAARKKYVDDLFVSAVVTVNSVNGYQGSVLLTTDDVDEGIYNLYYDDTKVDSHLNQTSATNNQILSWNGTDYAWVENSSFSTVSVTTSSGKFYIDGEQQSIATLQPGRTYRFDQSAASNSSHPLRFSEVSDGTHAGGGATEYTTGVTVNGTAGNVGAYVEIVVTNATPRLYYYCANHTGMGGKVSVGKELFVERITSDTWITGPIQTTTVNVGTGGSISASLATLDFTNTTVNFSGASIAGLSNSDVGLANIADNAQGVVVTGRVAAGSLELGTGGSINAQLGTLDFTHTTVNFSGANVGGLGDTIQDEVDFHLNKNNAGGSTIISDGQVLGWDSTGGAQGTGDYEWIDPRVITGHIIPDANETYDLGSSTNKFRDLYLSAGTLYLGDKTFSQTDILDFDLTIDPETFTINVDAPDAGGGMDWKWTWDAGKVAYTRLKITNALQSNIPLYNDGTYIVNNFAAHDLHGGMTQTHKIYLKWVDGPGTDNLVSWTTSTLNITGVTHPDINGGQSTEVQRLNINVPSTITPPTLNNPAISYNISFANAGAYTFGGSAHGDNPALNPLYRGGTYTFNLDASLTGHPFYLTTDDGTNYVSGTYVGEYTDGVTGSRNESGTLVFTVPVNAPDTLYYQCGIHGAMRGTITIKDLVVETNADNNYILYFQHDQQGHKTPVEIKPVPVIEDVDNLTLVWDGTASKFKAKDMGEYMDDTVQFQSKLEKVINESTVVETGLNDTEVSTKIKDETIFNINLHQGGALQVHTGTKRWYAPYNLQVTGITSRLGTAADATVGVDIKKNGVSEETYSFGTNVTTTTIADQTINMNANDYLTVDVTSIGTTNTGEDLYVQFTYKKV
jgi:hypothetical protein